MIARPVHPARALTVMVTALFGAGCAGAQETEADSVVGCYQFERDDGARALGLPWGFVLEDAALEPDWPVVRRSPDARRATTATSPTGRQDHPFGYWLRAAGDTIEVGYPGFGAGYLLRLAPRGQDLVGDGREVGDAVRAGDPLSHFPPRPVTARRVLCGAR